MALTDIALRALKPRDKTYTVADEKGLYVEVFPSGGIAWRFRYRLDGKLGKLTLGKYPALSLKNARKKRDEAAMGASPAHQKQLAKVAEADDTTLAQFSGRFFRDIQDKDRKDPTMPRRYFEKDILPFIGSKAVRDISTDDVRKVIWRKKDHGFDAAAGQIRGVIAPAVPACACCCALPVVGVRRRAARRRLPPRCAGSQVEDRKDDEQRLVEALRTPAHALRPALSQANEAALALAAARCQ